MKEIKTIEGEVKRIGMFDYYVKSDKCQHSNDEVCKNCILYGTELLKLPENTITDMKGNKLKVGDIVFYIGYFGTPYYNTRFKILEIKQARRPLAICLKSELKNIKAGQKALINEKSFILFNKDDVLEKIKGGNYILK